MLIKLLRRGKKSLKMTIDLEGLFLLKLQYLKLSLNYFKNVCLETLAIDLQIIFTKFYVPNYYNAMCYC